MANLERLKASKVVISALKTLVLLSIEGTLKSFMMKTACGLSWGALAQLTTVRAYAFGSGPPMTLRSPDVAKEGI